MDREEFAKRLYSTVIPEGTAPEDIQKLTRPVSEAIREMMLKRFFRYRAFDKRLVNPIKGLQWKRLVNCRNICRNGMCMILTI